MIELELVKSIAKQFNATVIKRGLLYRDGVHQLKLRGTAPDLKTTKQKMRAAVKAAEVALCGEVPLCLDALKGKSDSDRLTLVELNELSERLVDDSRFYANEVNPYKEQDQDL
jgi:hypothetical protein